MLIVRDADCAYQLEQLMYRDRLRSNSMETVTENLLTTDACHFCGSTQLRLVKSTSRARLLAEYKKTFGLSFPSPILESNFAFDSIRTFQCTECETVTFRPQIVGDGSYYDFLSRNLSWYYAESRWEYSIALETFDKQKQSVKRFLEVGCGDGHFLKLARDRGYDGHGSELNPQSIERLSASGFQVVTDLARDLADRQYDALVMFQVLEHILDPHKFLASLLPHVRSRGIIILSTPVTPSCSASVACHTLLLPPHHQSLPTALGFQRLAERLGCVCENVLFDPPDLFQVQFGLRKKLGWLPYFERYGGRLAGLTLRAARAMHCDWAVIGHTVLVVFRAP